MPIIDTTYLARRKKITAISVIIGLAFFVVSLNLSNPRLIGYVTSEETPVSYTLPGMLLLLSLIAGIITFVIFSKKYNS